jgi:hypothetical protein
VSKGVRVLSKNRGDVEVGVRRAEEGGRQNQGEEEQKQTSKEVYMKKDAGSQDREAEEGGEEGDQDSYEVTGADRGDPLVCFLGGKKGDGFAWESRSQARRARGRLVVGGPGHCGPVVHHRLGQ